MVVFALAHVANESGCESPVPPSAADAPERPELSAAFIGRVNPDLDSEPDRRSNMAGAMGLHISRRKQDVM